MREVKKNPSDVAIDHMGNVERKETQKKNAFFPGGCGSTTSFFLLREKNIRRMLSTFFATLLPFLFFLSHHMWENNISAEFVNGILDEKEKNP